MTLRRRPTAGDFALGSIGIAAALLFVVLAFVVPRMADVTDDVDARPGEPEPFAIELLADGRSIRVLGPISLGLTGQIEALLEDGASIRYLELDSPGGRVAEARGLVRLIETYGLATYVGRECLSACTLAFASGRTRILAPGARLGFHSYRQRSPHVGLFLDPATEMNRDMDILRRHSVTPSFIARIEATPHETMWYPDHRELLAARIVDRIGHPH
jgi:hypothetical protein